MLTHTAQRYEKTEGRTEFLEVTEIFRKEKEGKGGKWRERWKLWGTRWLRSEMPFAVSHMGKPGANRELQLTISSSKRHCAGGLGNTAGLWKRWEQTTGPESLAELPGLESPGPNWSGYRGTRGRGRLSTGQHWMKHMPFPHSPTRCLDQWKDATFSKAAGDAGNDG